MYLIGTSVTENLVLYLKIEKKVYINISLEVRLFWDTECLKWKSVKVLTWVLVDTSASLKDTFMCANVVCNVPAPVTFALLGLYLIKNNLVDICQCLSQIYDQI